MKSVNRFRFLRLRWRLVGFVALFLPALRLPTVALVVAVMFVLMAHWIHSLTLLGSVDAYTASNCASPSGLQAQFAAGAPQLQPPLVVTADSWPGCASQTHPEPAQISQGLDWAAGLMAWPSQFQPQRGQWRDGLRRMDLSRVLRCEVQAQDRMGRGRQWRNGVVGATFR